MRLITSWARASVLVPPVPPRAAFEKAIDTNKKRGLELYLAVPPSLEQLAH